MRMCKGPETGIGLVIPGAKETHVTGMLGDQVQENDVTKFGKISLSSSPSMWGLRTTRRYSQYKERKVVQWLELS